MSEFGRESGNMRLYYYNSDENALQDNCVLVRFLFLGDGYAR